MMIRRFLLAATTLCLLVGVSVAVAGTLPPGGSFADDDGNIHEPSIEAIAAAGITKGCNPPLNDLYCPDATVTRGQMAAFLVRALSLTDDGGGNSFIDDDGSIFETDIARLAAAGITKGCNPPDNTMYCPDSSVTRGQMAAFLVRAMGYTDSGAGDLFTDDDGSVFESDIDKLGTAAVTKGCNPPVNDRYCPDDPVKRDQMASFLTRALGLTPIVPPPPTSSTTTTLVVPPGGAFSGQLQSQPGFTGEISFATSSGNNEVMNPTLKFVFDNYKCDGVTLSGDGQSTIFTTVPVVNGSFAYYGGTLTWIGTFDSSTEASGTVAGTMLLGTSCDWGPLSWSATTISTERPGALLEALPTITGL